MGDFGDVVEREGGCFSRGKASSNTWASVRLGGLPRPPDSFMFPEAHTSRPHSGPAQIVAAHTLSPRVGEALIVPWGPLPFSGVEAVGALFV